jgi:hypothetical protein
MMPASPHRNGSGTKPYTGLGPNPRTVRIFIAETGIELPMEQVDLIEGENRRAPDVEKDPAG